MSTIKRFLIKEDVWRGLSTTNHSIIKQWFVVYSDLIQDTISITQQDGNFIGTRTKITHQPFDRKNKQVQVPVIDVSQLTNSFSSAVFKSSIGTTKTRYTITDNVHVEKFNNSLNTMLVLVDGVQHIPDWVDREVTDHSYYKHDYLISVR